MNSRSASRRGFLCGSMALAAAPGSARSCSQEIRSFGARVLGERNHRAFLQSQLDALEPGGVLHLPAGSKFQVRNAERSGASAEDRMTAQARGELSALTCATDGVTVIVDGEIESRSVLDDLFRFTGRGVNVKGTGSLRGPGQYLDTNPARRTPAEQWRPALLNMAGEASRVEDLRIEQPPAVGLHLQGSNSVADRVTVIGGPRAAGQGTFLMGISVGAPVERSSGQRVRNCEFRPGSDGGAVYSGVYVVASDVELLEIRGNGLWHHLIYNYGAGCRIIRAEAADTGRAAVQSFAPNCSIEAPHIQNCRGGVAVENFSGTHIVNGVFVDMSLSAISARRFYQTPTSIIERSLTISGNSITLKGGRRQAGIDIELDCGASDFVVASNRVKGAPDGPENEAAYRVLFTNPQNPGRACVIQDNLAENSEGFAGVFLGLRGGRITRNRAVNANTHTGETAWWLRRSEDVEVTGNSAENTRENAKTQRILLADASEFSENRRIVALGNEGKSLARGELPIVSVPQDGRKSGNIVDGLPVTGRFVLPKEGAVQITEGAARAIRRGARVVVSPLNESARALEATPGALALTSLSPGEVSFGTADSRSARGSELYAYRVLQ